MQIQEIGEPSKGAKIVLTVPNQNMNGMKIIFSTLSIRSFLRRNSKSGDSNISSILFLPALIPQYSARFDEFC